MEILFNKEDQITDQWLVYMENKANTLAERSELEIDNFINEELLNPQVIAFLNTIDLEEDDKDEIEPFVINELALKGISSPLSFFKFKKLKKKIKKIFCKVSKELIDAKAKDIIKAVLVLLIPALAGGIPALLLPIVIGYIAKLIKKGHSAVCD